MPTYHRCKIEEATYFFTVVTHGRRPWFRCATYRRWLGACFREVRRTMPFSVDAVVLLPDHLRILMRPGRGTDYSALWRDVKTRLTRRVIARLSEGDRALRGQRAGERRVWQRRFYEHMIRDERDWQSHVDYIHLNPAKHGYVNLPQQWPWSSIHRFIRNGWLDARWPGSSPVDLPDVQE